ncbi:hypothetical protein [Streptomyces sp. NPDC008121]|uniref:hypothetical protein n=1 Tax=Streptomyces sp. NPDC008121 TaxID=3364809 RepID=UPI0036E5E37C
MRRLTTTALAVISAVLLAACGTTATPDPAAKPKATPAESKPPATLSPEAKASIRAAAGLPPDPDATTRQAYLDALNAIDPRIIKSGKEDQAVSRGINQCGSIKTTKDEAKLAETALERFTVGTRLPDIATPDTGRKIVKAVHTHLCPDF